ncbi:MAG: AAA family ATPase [Fimbriimonadaceae bacterium]|nr:AAA family ATPase [Fimbriimonadaceae bacterium]
MLHYLGLRGIGPAPELDLEFGDRLNLLTGDNGLGKSFVLDVAWWVLTRTWARRMVVPRVGATKPTIRFGYGKRTAGDLDGESQFSREKQAWTVQRGRPAVPGLVLYAQVDGGFAVWDPARNYWRDADRSRPAAYHLAAAEVWEGNRQCEGLIRDWASWQREQGDRFRLLRAVLERLSPSPEETLQPGDLVRILADDPRDYPTLRMPYGEDVAVVHASAGMRRILALAYLLVWAWHEHRLAAELRGQPASNEIIFLVDEIEAHLHPQWQRRIVPALLGLLTTLTDHADARVQLLTATHSPLVLASAEDDFDPAQDRLFTFDLQDSAVRVIDDGFAARGTADNWLTSAAFGLRSALGSVEQEQLLSDLSMASLQPDLTREQWTALRQRLAESSLAETDPARARWHALGVRRGWLE